MADWIKKKSRHSLPYTAYKRLISEEKTYTDWKWGVRKDIHVHGNGKRVGIVLLKSDNIDFKRKTVIKDKEGSYIMIKGLI